MFQCGVFVKNRKIVLKKYIQKLLFVVQYKESVKAFFIEKTSKNGVIFLKNKMISCGLALIFAVLALCACGTVSSKASLEGFFVALKKFDVEKMSKCVAENSADYFDQINTYSQMLSEEQLDIVKKLCSHIGYSEKEGEEQGNITLSYVDLSSVMKSVEDSMAIGEQSASEYIEKILNSAGFASQYVKKADIFVSVSESGEIDLGYTSMNKDLTRYLGLDTFLRWYSEKR